MKEKNKKTEALDNLSKAKFKFEINGIAFESDPPELVMGPAFTTESDLQEFWVQISDGVKTYDRMCYTTDLGTVGLIFANMTIRSSSLSNAKLNDIKEKERVGVSQFASGRFITCFSHNDHESVPFWVSYGGEKKEKRYYLNLEILQGTLMNA